MPALRTRSPTSPNRSACCSPRTPPSLYAGVRNEAQLGQALISRVLIGQAKGILMERYKISGERAFLVVGSG